MQKSANPQTPYAKQHSQGPSRRWGRKIGRARKSGTCSELKSPGSIRRYTPKVSPTCPCRTHLGENGTNVHAKLMKKKRNASNPAPRTTDKEKRWKQGRWILSEKSTLIIVQCQVVSTKNIHPSNILRIPLDRRVRVYTYIYVGNGN